MSACIQGAIFFKISIVVGVGTTIVPETRIWPSDYIAARFGQNVGQSENTLIHYRAVE